MKEIGAGKVKVFYGGEDYLIPAEADEQDVRDAMTAQFPEVANSNITKDEESGNWTVTREAGQKG